LRWFKLGLVLTGATLIGLVGYRYFFPDDAKLIRARLKELAAAASLRADEAPLARVNNTGRLCAFFTEDVVIAIEAGERTFRINGRQELFQAVMSARANYGPATVEFLDARVEIGPDRRSAVAFAAGRIRGNLDGDPNIQELQFSFVKVGRKWYISRVELAHTLRL
jgi:hypothetical protein